MIFPCPPPAPAPLAVEQRLKDRAAELTRQHMAEGLGVVPLASLRWQAERDVQAQRALSCFLGERSAHLETRASLDAEKLAHADTAAELYLAQVKVEHLEASLRQKVSPQLLLVTGGVALAAGFLGGALLTR